MNQPVSSDDCNDIALRLFIGIACPPLDKVADLLKELQLAAPQPASGIRVIPANNLHITVKFLGAVHFSAIAGVTAILDQAAVEAVPFVITLAGAGIFKDAF